MLFFMQWGMRNFFFSPFDKKHVEFFSVTNRRDAKPQEYAQDVRAVVALLQVRRRPPPSSHILPKPMATWP